MTLAHKHYPPAVREQNICSTPPGLVWRGICVWLCMQVHDTYLNAIIVKTFTLEDAGPPQSLRRNTGTSGTWVLCRYTGWTGLNCLELDILEAEMSVLAVDPSWPIKDSKTLFTDVKKTIFYLIIRNEKIFALSYYEMKLWRRVSVPSAIRIQRNHSQKQSESSCMSKPGDAC